MPTERDIASERAWNAHIDRTSRQLRAAGDLSDAASSRSVSHALGNYVRQVLAEHGYERRDSHWICSGQTATRQQFYGVVAGAFEDWVTERELGVNGTTSYMMLKEVERDASSLRRRFGDGSRVGRHFWEHPGNLRRDAPRLPGTRVDHSRELTRDARKGDRASAAARSASDESVPQRPKPHQMRLL